MPPLNLIGGRDALRPPHRKTQWQRIRRFSIKRVISKAQEMQTFKMQIVFFKMNGISCLAMRLCATTRGNKNTILSSVSSTRRCFFCYLSGFLSAFLTTSLPDVSFTDRNSPPPSDLVSQRVAATKQVAQKRHSSHSVWLTRSCSTGSGWGM